MTRPVCLLMHVDAVCLLMFDRCRLVCTLLNVNITKTVVRFAWGREVAGFVYTVIRNKSGFLTKFRELNALLGPHRA